MIFMKKFHENKVNTHCTLKILKTKRDILSYEISWPKKQKS